MENDHGVVRRRRSRDNTTARSEAAQFLADLQRPTERVRTAKELCRYINVSLKNEDPQFIDEFLHYLDSRDDQSVIFECTYSDLPDTRKMGLFLIVALSEVVPAGRVKHYANFLHKIISFPRNDESTMDLAARAMIYLIQTSKICSAELLEMSTEKMLEWMQELPRNEIRRHASVLLARELAMYTPTSFFLKASLFFKAIFPVIGDPKHTVRLAAVQALHAALVITSQREARQKQEWYQTCLNEALKIETAKSHEAIHSCLLILNELIRITDANYEKMRLEAVGEPPDPPDLTECIDWLVHPRSSSTVESTTAKQLVKDNFDAIMKCVLNNTSRDQHVVTVLLELYPRLSAWRAHCTDEQRNKMWQTMKTILPKQSEMTALTSMGLMIKQSPAMFRDQAQHVMTKCREMLKNAINKKATAVDSNVFVYLRMYVRAYREADEPTTATEVKGLLDTLFRIPLSQGLTSFMHEVTYSVPSLTTDVLDGLMKVLYQKLTKVPLPSKIDDHKPALVPFMPIEIKPEEEADIVLALDTLGSFRFQRHALQMCMRYVADGYLTAESVPVRLAAVRCCVAMIKPFVKVYASAHREHRQWIVELINGILRCLVSVGVIDSNVVVRQSVFECFIEVEDKHFLSHLAQPHMLELLFMALHDEKLEMQESAVSLLTLLSELNPALALPRLRRVLLETLSQLTNSGQARLEQHSARLLVQMAAHNPKFVRPYMGPLLTALVPKLRADIKHVDVTIQVLNAISELCIIGGAEVVKVINPLFKLLTVFVSDSSSLQRREAALMCIGRISRATAYVVDPYRDYPNLLDDLLRLLKTEMSSSMRRQAIKVLGILGAVDPYTHKVFTKAVQAANTVSTAMSLPINKFDASESVHDIIQWFNYEKCTLDEYYPAITIANLMAMVQDEAYSTIHKDIGTALMTIFKSLGSSYPQYVHQVIPRLIEVTRAHPTNREFFLIQLAGLVAIIKGHAKPYLKPIFKLIADAWSENDNVKTVIVGVVEQIGMSLGQEFSPYISELIPYLLKVVQSDRDRERRLTERVVQCVRNLSSCLSTHLQLIIPPLLSIIDEKVVPMPVRLCALNTILHLVRNEDVTDYAPRLMQCWQKNIHCQELQRPLMELLLEIHKQMWKRFSIFRRSVEIALVRNNINQGELFERYTEGLQEMDMSTAPRRPSSANGYKLPLILPNSDHSSQSGSAQPIGKFIHQVVPKQLLFVDAVVRACNCDSLVSKEDWAQWLVRLRSAFIKSGSSAALRAAAAVCDHHQHLSKELFNAAFMSVWTELTAGQQDEVRDWMAKALLTSDQSDVIHTILNLAEFMDHSEKGPLPIALNALRTSSVNNKAYAKALRYTEIDIYQSGRKEKGLTSDDCQALITFANKLNVQEEAAGVVHYAEHHQIEMQGRWYEKLNDWEKALESYKDERTRPDAKIDEITAHELRCLEALGQWSSMNVVAKQLMTAPGGPPKDPKLTVIAARGAWAVGDFMSMKQYVMNLTENSQDGSFLRAVLAVRAGEYEAASAYIDKVRDMYDSQLTTMASESYERAYGAMIQVQQLAELEEAMEYKIRVERRPRIALLWARRLQGCRQNIEQWQRLIMLRSLVLTPQEMHPLRVKFASLCRQQGKMSMCRSVLRELLGLQPNANLNEASAPFDRPQLVLALCKQLWVDNCRGTAVNTLDSLVNYLFKFHNKEQLSPEESRLCSKACLKLGQWIQMQDAVDVSDRQPLLSPKLPQGDIHAQYDNKVLAQQYPTFKTSNSLMPPHEQEQLAKAIVCYKKALHFDDSWYKAWHKLAIAHLHVITREKELAERAAVAMNGARSPSMPPPPPQMPTPPMPPQMMGAPMGPPPNMAMMTMMPPPTMMTPGMPPIPPMPMSMHNNYAPLSPLQMPSPDHPKPNITHAMEAIRCFTKALSLAPGSRLENTLRLLQLWFEFGERDEVYKLLRENIKGLPVETWLEVIPQLMARLDSSERMASLIKQVIHEISKSRPQALVYALTVAAKSTNQNRKRNAEEMIIAMADLHKKLVEEASMVSNELVRCAILWHEQWHDALDDASRLYFQEKNIKAMMDVLRPLHEMIEKGHQTLKEQSFNQTYYADLADAYKFCKAYETNKNPKELSQAWEIYCQIFKRIANQLRTLTALDLNYISPALMKAKDLELAVPGTFDPDPTKDVIRIESIGTALTVINSKQRPRKMTIRGSDGHDYQFLLKGHEDPRQDERVMQLFGLVNTLLVNNSETCRRNLTIQRYSITALSQNSGLIGWIPNCDTLHAMIKDYREKKKLSLSLEHKTIQSFSNDTEQLTLMQKLEVFEKAIQSNNGDDLRCILWLKSPSSEVWFDRRTNYTRSVACMSMVGYILGLGDRHPSNLMLDRLTGKIVHIDFGDCFDVAMTREKFPERVPFRLTRMLINAMEVTGIEGTYKYTCERVLKLLRTNRESLLAVLEAFVYDPVINWRLLDGVKKDPNKNNEGNHPRHPPQIQQEAPAAVSQKVINRIKQKLAGLEFGREEKDEKEQIENLIEQATLAENLCQAYIGWCPFW